MAWEKVSVMSHDRSPPSLTSLIPLTQAFSRRRVLVLGDLVADHYIYGQTERVSREAPVLVVRYESSEVQPGGAANAAANVRSLGGRATAIGLLGRDEMGARLEERCRALGVVLKAVKGPGGVTETKTRILAGGISTTRQQMLRLDTSAPSPSSSIRRALRERVAQEAKRCDAILVSDYGAGVICEELRLLLRKLAADGMTVCADSRYALRSLTGLTVCKPNEPELQALTGLPVTSRAELLRAGQAGQKLLRSRALLVTRGKNGMALFQPKGRVDWIDVHGAQEAVDVTGAGDTVIAALTLSLAAGGGLLEAAQLANAAGARVVQKQGTATVSQEELERELERGEAR